MSSHDKRGARGTSWQGSVAAIITYEILSNFKRKKFLALFAFAFVVSAAVWIPTVATMFPGVPNPPSSSVLTSPRYDPLFAGSLFFPFLALVLTMDSVAGEFEFRSMEILLTKSLNRGAIFLGKLLGGLLTAVAIIAVLIISEIVFSTVIYGPQSNLYLLLTYFAGSSFSFLIWLSLAFIVAFVTKNVLFTIFGVLGYVIVEQLLDPFLGTLIPGYGIEIRNPEIGSGSAALGPLLPYYFQNPGASVTLASCSVPCVAVSTLLFQAIVVGTFYILLFLTLSYYSFIRAEIK